MTRVIFSIDNPTPLRVNQLTGMFFGADTVGRLVPCIGSWEGVTEVSFLCNLEDYVFVVKPLGYADNQDCVLEVSDCNKAYAVLVYADGRREGIGSLKNVTADEAMQCKGWTYRPDLGMYWTTVEGNPDGCPPPQGWPENRAMFAGYNGAAC